MPVFDESDFDGVGKKEKEIPDGLIDGSGYVDVFKYLLTHLENLEVDNYESKVKFMMNLVNPVYRENNDSPDMTYVFNLITAMSFHLVHLLQVAGGSDDYAYAVREQILPHIEREAQAIPYWE